MTDQSQLPDPFPPKGTKAYQLLAMLLAGEKVDTVRSMMELNLQTPNARVTEMRAMGWPIRSVKVPHPKLPNEKIVEYSFSSVFLRWYVEDHKGTKHPLLFPNNDGRMKFKAEYVRNEK